MALEDSLETRSFPDPSQTTPLTAMVSTALDSDKDCYLGRVCLLCRQPCCCLRPNFADC